MTINVKRSGVVKPVEVHFITRPIAYAEGQRCYPKSVPVWVKPSKNIKLRAAWSA